MRRLFTHYWTIFAVVALAILGGCAKAPKEQPPSVVLVVVDTLRADRLTAERNGVPVMPELRKIAEESVWFTDANAQSTWTKPSMVSLFTSLYTGVHNIRFGIRTHAAQDIQIDVLPSEFETMANVFKKAGYETHGIQTNHQLLAQFGFGQGFDTYAELTDADAAVVTEKALEILNDASRPVFLYVHYMDPHAPYDPPQEFAQLFGEAPEIPESDLTKVDPKNYVDYYNDRVNFDIGVSPKRTYADLSDDGRELIRYNYDGECRSVDAAVSALVRQAQAKDAAVVFTADHGEELWDHGSVGHSKTLFQELVHVPLIFSIPGHEPRTVETPVELIDILPALAQFADLDVRNQWQGRNILANSLELEPVFSATSGADVRHDFKLRSVRLGNKKLIVDGSSTEHPWRLYDLTQDPDENDPCKSQCEKELEELSPILGKHQKSNSEHPLAGLAGQSTPVPNEILEILDSLGYIRDL